jgi:hypothetical protein
MPTWGEILQELQTAGQQNPAVAPFDSVRRKYLTQLNQHSGRNTILYATRWTQPIPNSDPSAVSITDEDIHGFMEVVHGLNGPNLDLIIHSPGGLSEAAAAIVSYLRSKFTDIRVIIPHAAMSAATMLSCASNRIVMGRHSFIGPTDPQFLLQTQLGIRYVPAQAILDQFDMAKTECRDPQSLGAWLPILSQYGPATLVECKNALELSEHFVSTWLARYMFADLINREEANQRAGQIAKDLANHQQFMSHSYHIDRDRARSLNAGQGLIIDDLETNQVFQDDVLSVYHATMHTFNGTPAVKIIENHLGRAYVKRASLPAAQIIPPQQNPPVAPPQPPRTGL